MPKSNLYIKKEKKLNFNKHFVTLFASVKAKK